jgi:hypothetical protein
MRKEWNFEILSWLFIGLFTLMVIFPIYAKCHEHYPFYFRNILALIIFLSLTRYIFLLKFVPYSRSKIWRALMIILCIPIFFYSLDSLFLFKKYIDEEGTITFFKESQQMSDYEFGRYIRYQYIFFAVSALITILIMPVRMIISFWRTTNTMDRI